MRGAEMDDVIFSGAAERPAQSRRGVAGARNGDRGAAGKANQPQLVWLKRRPDSSSSESQIRAFWRRISRRRAERRGERPERYLPSNP
jgi:hypothetical protein